MHLRVYRFFAAGPFWSTAAFTSALNARASTWVPSWMSIALRGWFQSFEKALDIPHVSGRGWYGVRRKATDMAEDSITDARALNFMTGHADTKTRRGYQSVTREVRLLAIHARQAIRNRLEVVPELVPRAKDVVQDEETKRPNQL